MPRGERTINAVRVAFIAAILATIGIDGTAQTTASPVERAALHPIVRDKPGPDFFEGALLGNGAMGAVVTTRPDAIVVHFGHNNIWDIRIAEGNKEKIGTFREIFDKVKAIPSEAPSLESDPWYREYMHMTRENYDKPYPRPFPCGSVLLGFDRRNVELLGYRLDIASGICDVNLLVENKPARLLLFTDMESDRLWMRLVDSEDNPLPNCFERVKLMPDPETPTDIPAFRANDIAAPRTISFSQVLPFDAPVDGAAVEASSKDRAFRLSFTSNAELASEGRVDLYGQRQQLGALERSLNSQDPFVACIQLDNGLASALSASSLPTPKPTEQNFQSSAARAQEVWRAYWARSGVALDDDLLERVWYWNHYFLNCATKSGVNCPGLFANWSYRRIGTAWHGDYHMNYNTQQAFWLPFSSNRVEKNLAYVELVERLLPVARTWARDYYGMRGAYFPHSAYPVEMTMSPYPVPTWGWEICETPWTVQGLWWHFLYTMDEAYLRDRAFVPIRDAVLFLIDYMKRPEAHGPQWGDDKFHVFPTVPPELYGLRPGFKYNNDCLVDLTLIKFVMKAYLEAARVLEIERAEAETIRDVRDILDHFPEYPTAESQRGKVFVSVPGEHSEVVFNVPNSLMTVFPGEDHGLHSPPDVYQTLVNAYHNHQNEGGNDLVFLNLQAARLGLLDLDRFRRQVNYCLIDNGTCADMVSQVHGRYDDTIPFNFMRPMGIWFENFGLPVVINECLLQSYNGTIRLFPNWPLERAAEFTTLRAAGAFLVSASCAKGSIEHVKIVSEAGGRLRVVTPWKLGARIVKKDGETIVKDALIDIPTQVEEIVTLLPLEK